MCGIAGLVAEKHQVVERALAAMTAAQLHRGPNDSGENVLPLGRQFLGFGHRRLSIIDLSCAGHQPMVHPDTGDQLIYNGEIYNFPELRRSLESAGERFVGHSDTEVLLHALTRWGPDCLRRLQGMYAFAFYEARHQRLLLARDPLGIKPLYLARAGGGLLFASEVRAIMSCGLVPRNLDLQGVAGLLAYGTPQQPCTIFQDVKSFPAGSYQYFDSVDASPWPPVRFWSYPSRRSDLDPTRALSTIETTLDAAVHDHLVSDVPVGVFLSSGLDSTVIAALAARHTPHLRSFTVGFADQPDLSELSLAAETARLMGLDHTEIQVQGHDAEQAAMDWLSSNDQPSLDGLNVYIISKFVRAQGITVALSGQGGDELFGGYPSFADVPRMFMAMKKVRWLPPRLRMKMARGLAGFSSKAVRQKLSDIMGSRGSVLGLYLQRRRAMSDGQLAELGLHPEQLGLTEDFLPSEAYQGLHPNEHDVVWSVSQLESHFYQGNTLLRDSDANGMAHSLEIRVPMLDQRMVDLLLALPGDLRLPSGRADKHLLRVAFAPLLRPALREQAKRGFTLPIRRWMVGPLRDLCEHGIANLKSLDVLRPEGIDAIWSSFLREPETQIWSRAFTLCVLGMYVKQMKLT